MKLRECTTGAGKMLAGMGLGAAVMYLLDPDSGHRRREQLKQRSAKLAGTSGAAMATLLEQARDNATDLSHRIHDQFAHLRRRDIAEQLRHLAHGRRQARPQTGPLVLAGVALGAMAIGAGLMFLLDPQQGIVRRSLIRNQASRAARSARGYAQSTVGRWTGGASDQPEAPPDLADPTADDEALATRVRAAIAAACTNPSNVYVSVRGDHIILSGSLPAQEQEAVLARCQAIPGVARVVNNLTETATV